MLFLLIMFAENFFLSLSLWREQPMTTPRHSLWQEDPQGIRRQFVIARVAGARAVRPSMTRVA